MSEPSTKQILEGAAPIVAEEISEQVTEALHNANSAINGVADAVGLTEKVEESPYAMLAAALGVGYVLGGGLFTPTTARLLRLGMKVASIPLVRDQLLDVAEAAVDGVLGSQAKKEESDS
ncbi:MAG: hypothetical protein Q8L14_00340 [Myxococcales bacterium]|nr:hypothetical protein [Myxococcales bacterium]